MPKRDRARIDFSIQTLEQPTNFDVLRASMQNARMLGNKHFTRVCLSDECFITFIVHFTDSTTTVRLTGLTPVAWLRITTRIEAPTIDYDTDVFSERLPDKEWSITIWAENRSLDCLFQDTPEYSLCYVISGAARGLLRLWPLTARRTVPFIGAVAPSDDYLVNFLQYVHAKLYMHVYTYTVTYYRYKSDIMQIYWRHLVNLFRDILRRYTWNKLQGGP